MLLLRNCITKAPRSGSSSGGPPSRTRASDLTNAFLACPHLMALCRLQDSTSARGPSASIEAAAGLPHSRASPPARLRKRGCLPRCAHSAATCRTSDSGELCAAASGSSVSLAWQLQAPGVRSRPFVRALHVLGACRRGCDVAAPRQFHIRRRIVRWRTCTARPVSVGTPAQKRHLRLAASGRDWRLAATLAVNGPAVVNSVAAPAQL